MGDTTDLTLRDKAQILTHLQDLAKTLDIDPAKMDDEMSDIIGTQNVFVYLDPKFNGENKAIKHANLNVCITNVLKAMDFMKSYNVKFR